jgi:D-alanyl-D-alanine carboxypeptidase/D-alanyl-D-alanine-endopeptidase (penicillin-binding protein 4)
MLTLRRVAVLLAVVLSAGLATVWAEGRGAGVTGLTFAASLSSQQTAELRQIIADPLLKKAKVTAQVLNVRTGQVLFAENPDLFVMPASTNKLVTAGAAMAVLGPNYQFATRVLADHRPDENGVINGNLYIVGGGDPTLTIEKVWLLAHGVRIAGVKKVTGDLVGDDSFHDNVRFYPEWGRQSFRAYHASLGALSVNWNTITFWVRPGPRPGTPAVVTLDPHPAGMHLTGTIQTVEGARSKCTMSMNHDHVEVSGTIGVESNPGPTHQAIHEPLEFALGAIREQLTREGVEIVGASRAGATPSQATLIHEHQSDFLSQIIRNLYRWSNNFTAEQIFRTLGAVRGGAPGTRAKGAAAVEAWLRENNLWRDGIVIFDGSGLSRDNRESASTMVGVLNWMAHNPPLFAQYLEAQPIAGVDGTMRFRFKHSPLNGRVRAKTGLLDGAIGLGGYCYDARNELYAFTVLINDFDPREGVHGPQRVTEHLLEVLMQ